MKIICIGRNYRKHIEELNNEKPSSPVIFIKPDSSIILKNQPFFIPDYSNEIHYEAEVILKICKLGKSIDKRPDSAKADALTRIALGNFIDFREEQL